MPAPVLRKTEVVARLLEDGTRLLGQRASFPRSIVLAEKAARVCTSDGPPRTDDGVAGERRLLGGRERLLVLSYLLQREREVRCEGRARIGALRKKLARSTKQAARRDPVAPIHRADARQRRERRPRARPSPASAGSPVSSSDSVPVRLLEVVADDLVALDEVVLREPVGEALVQLGARRLRQRLVGRVADEQMAEAEALVVGERRRRRADELLAHERRRGATRPPARTGPGESSATAPRWKTSPSTEPRSMTTRTSPSSESIRACRSAWIVGGTTISPSPPCSRTIASISST